MTLADGTYLVNFDNAMLDVFRHSPDQVWTVEGGRCVNATWEYTVDNYLKQGATFTPAVILTRAEYDALVAQLDEAQALVSSTIAYYTQLLGDTTESAQEEE